ncbi:MAG: SpoIIE family protein phosphatase, partial [Planctomycetota bacterium]
MSTFFLQSSRLGRDFELSEGMQNLGRNPKCDIHIDHDQVSRQHLELRLRENVFAIRDEKSKHNTHVNGREIRGMGWVAIEQDDLIELCGAGGIDLRLVRPGAPDAEHPSAASVRSSLVIPHSRDDSRLHGPRSKSLSLSDHGVGGEPHAQLNALLRMTGMLRDVLRTEDVLERAVASLFQIIPAADRAAICFVDDEGAIEPKWWHVRDVDPDHTIRISQNIGRHVIEKSQAVILSDAKEDFGELQSVELSSMRSVMCSPLLDADDRVFGLVHLDSYLPGRFTEADLEIFAAVATQIALAINCGRLHAVAVEDAVLRRDIEQAEEVQRRFLPETAPQLRGFELDGFYRAARLVGGDYFDYIQLPDDRLAIVVADVVGKGVPAALTMVRLATETRAGVEVCQSPSALLSRLNERLANEFITMAVLIVDPSTGGITLSNAGHEPPMLKRADGAVESMDVEVSGCPVGVLEDEEYTDVEVH